MQQFACFLGLVLALASLPNGASAAPAGAGGSFTFVQMCDPQLGFGGYAEDLARFETATKQINELSPEFVVICGDLVNAASEKSFGDFNSTKARLKMPCYCAPGNHDISNNPNTNTLERYRKLIGKDYYSFEHKGCAFVVVNSQIWKTPIAGETEKQDQWLKATLEAAAGKKQPVFVVSHYLLFVKEPEEPANYFNLPLEKRKELLALFERCGVVALLAGHTHKTAALEYHGIQMVTSETTSKNFDNRPFGFRVWHVGTERPYPNEFEPLQAVPQPRP